MARQVRRRRRYKPRFYVLMTLLVVLASTAFFAFAFEKTVAHKIAEPPVAEQAQEGAGVSLQEASAEQGARSADAAGVDQGGAVASAADAASADAPASAEETSDALGSIRDAALAGADFARDMALRLVDFLHGYGESRSEELLAEADVTGALRAEDIEAAIRAWGEENQRLNAGKAEAQGDAQATGENDGNERGGVAPQAKVFDEAAVSGALAEIDRDLAEADRRGVRRLEKLSPLMLALGAAGLVVLGVILGRILARGGNGSDKEDSVKRPPTMLTYDGCVLSKIQNAGIEFLYIFSGDPRPNYKSFVSLLDKELSKEFTEEKYVAFLDEVSGKFGGDMTEVRFIAFERLDSFDQLTYFASFTKERMVVIRLGFSKRGRIVYFRLEPFKKESDTPAEQT